ncbi:FAD-dependent oxidoreductase [Nonomuraea lactucae]|uniref:FAD-dependent oxidoreductase n=1 Tax=Nonomuraea lactucae TaxID=2249762 RepID=UPI000DE56FEB|nr:FAD-dependent oxidoreductase [Nonomuraea lactucae]
MTVDIVVLGAGPAGLAAALFLASDGHRVTVFDRDSAEPEAGDRPGVSQFRQPHVLLPRGLAVLERQLPEVVATVESGGGRRWNLLAGARAAPHHRYEALAVRRPVLEGALVEAAARRPNIEIRRGVGVRTLRTGRPGAGGVPHVNAVVTESGETVRATLVVDAGGDDSPVSTLIGGLHSVGRRLALRADAGFDFHSRYFHAAGGRLPPQPAWPLQHHDSISTLALPSGDGTWSLTLVVSRRDRVMRSLYEEHVWDRVAALFPDLREWVAYGEPVTGVLQAAGPVTRRRRSIAGGHPPATGLVSVGDAWATTNPAFCQGMSMAFVQAELLREAVRAHDAPDKLVLGYEEAAHRALGPFYDTLAFWEHNRLGDIYARIHGRRFYDSPTWAVAKALDAAKPADPEVLTAMADMGSMLVPPGEVLAREGLVGRALALAEEAPTSTLAREEVLTAISR